MKLLLDQGLPRSTSAFLRDAGHDVVHTGEISMSRASDAEIIARAEEDRVVFTFDADFHSLLAQSRAVSPSVVRIRIERLKARTCADVILKVIEECEPDLLAGAAVSVEPTRIRVHKLPLKQG